MTFCVNVLNYKQINNNKKIQVKYYFFDWKKLINKVGIFLDFRSGPEPESDPDPLFPDSDPRIWIQIKMKRIHNTGPNNEIHHRGKSIIQKLVEIVQVTVIYKVRPKKWFFFST